MPVYEYSCENCHISDEFLLSMNHDKPLCEKCGNEMTRVVSKVSFHLKGGCWAKDGYTGGGGYKPGEALKEATNSAKRDLKDTMDGLEKKSRL